MGFLNMCIHLTQTWRALHSELNQTYIGNNRANPPCHQRQELHSANTRTPRLSKISKFNYPGSENKRKSWSHAPCLTVNTCMNHTKTGGGELKIPCIARRTSAMRENPPLDQRRSTRYYDPSVALRTLQIYEGRIQIYIQIYLQIYTRYCIFMTTMSSSARRHATKPCGRWATPRLTIPTLHLDDALLINRQHVRGVYGTLLKMHQSRLQNIHACPARTDITQVNKRRGV